MRYCGILALPCAVLRYSYPPYAPLWTPLMAHRFYLNFIDEWINFIVCKVSVKCQWLISVIRWWSNNQLSATYRQINANRYSINSRQIITRSIDRPITHCFRSNVMTNHNRKNSKFKLNFLFLLAIEGEPEITMSYLIFCDINGKSHLRCKNWSLGYQYLLLGSPFKDFGIVFFWKVIYYSRKQLLKWTCL